MKEIFLDVICAVLFEKPLSSVLTLSVNTVDVGRISHAERASKYKYANHPFAYNLSLNFGELPLSDAIFPLNTF